jgi:hypothetical protein
MTTLENYLDYGSVRITFRVDRLSKSGKARLDSLYYLDVLPYQRESYQILKGQDEVRRFGLPPVLECSRNFRKFRAFGIIVPPPAIFSPKSPHPIPLGG